MKKSLIAVLVASAVAAPTVVMAEDSPHSFTGNIGIVSDYLFRGISQTEGGPAIQGGIDYAHSSGFYVGTWLSSISWVSDTQGGSYPTEIDLYGGYRGAINDDFSFDVGAITYNYPGSGRNEESFVKPFTAEIYGALTWKWLTAKYSYVVSDNFVGWGVPNGAQSDGSSYFELNAAYDLGGGWGISGHVGNQVVQNYESLSDAGGDDASYTDWNIGVTKDVGFGVIGVKYSDTNADNCGSTTEAYCWNGYSAGKGRGLVSFTKTF